MLRSRRWWWMIGAVLLAGSALLVKNQAQACFMRSPMPVTVWLDHIEVEIKDQVAVKTYNCTFKNPNAQAIVGGTCYMELEPGAQVDNMSVLVDGKEHKAEILDVKKAKKVFADIVQKGGSPALLEYFGNQLIQTQVPKIAPNGTVTVKLTYTTVMKRRGDLYRLQCLNTNPKAAMQPLKAASVRVKITSKDPIKQLYSPTHSIKIEECPDADVCVTWEQKDYMPKHPFVLYYDTDDEAVAARVIAHRDVAEPGHFMMMLSPSKGKDKDHKVPVLPKDIVFCVDTSGSMLEGDKMDQARKALQYCLSQLRTGDRFNIVDFSTDVRSFKDDLVEVNDTTQAQAATYAKRLAPRGGTAIEEALKKSIGMFDKKDRLKMIVFATDGTPTIGETNPENIIKNVTTANTNDVRLFVFGEGLKVNTKLLDFLAQRNNGESDYILPKEDISKKISGFFDRIGSPILTNVKVEIDGLEVEDIYPKNIPDIYKGEQVIVYGKYSGHGEKTVKLTGNFGGETKTFTFKCTFPEVSDDDKAAFVPRLWAGRKVDALLSTMRANGESDELVKEVTYLAKRYGIVTPYTSYLMTTDIVNADSNALNRKTRGKFAAAPGAGGGWAQPQDQKAQAKAVEEAKDLARLRKEKGESGAADAMYRQAEKALRDDDATGQGRSVLTTMHYVGNKTFYKQDGVWYDSTYDPKTDKDKVQKVVVGSDKYLDLLTKHTRLMKYMSLGNVLVKYNGTWYHFEPKKDSK